MPARDDPFGCERNLAGTDRLELPADHPGEHEQDDGHDDRQQEGGQAAQAVAEQEEHLIPLPGRGWSMHGVGFMTTRGSLASEAEMTAGPAVDRSHLIRFAPA